MAHSGHGGRIAAAAVAFLAVLSSPHAADCSVRWVTGYYAAYSEFQPGVNMPPSAVDYTALTHVIHWPVVPLADGTFDPEAFGMTVAQSAAVVSLAHNAGTRAILGFGGDAFTVGNGWQGATSPANRAQFIASMVTLMQTRGYDGIDINWEELTLGDGPQFTAFVTELRAALDAIVPRPLLTVVPTSGSDAAVSLVAAVQQHFDQINIQTYVMSGPYPGWVTWFNSPIFNGGFTFPSTGGPVPSADAEVDRFIAGGRRRRAHGRRERAPPGVERPDAAVHDVHAVRRNHPDLHSRERLHEDVRCRRARTVDRPQRPDGFRRPLHQL